MSIKYETPAMLAALQSRLHYVPDTGKFYWISNPYGRAKIGDEAGCSATDGYRRIYCLGRFYQAHRVAWALHYGRWPKRTLDHINGVLSDNRIVNLRECEVWENQANVGRRKDNTTGYRGVHRAGKRFGTHIRVRGHLIYLGRFDNAEQASAAYEAAAVFYRGEFATSRLQEKGGV